LLLALSFLLLTLVLLSWGKTDASEKLLEEGGRYDLLLKGHCVPGAATIGQLVHVVVKYLKDHSEKLHDFASILLSDALSAAFPCKTGVALPWGTR
jgi:hypothetical protein